MRNMLVMRPSWRARNSPKY